MFDQLAELINKAGLYDKAIIRKSSDQWTLRFSHGSAIFFKPFAKPSEPFRRFNNIFLVGDFDYRDRTEHIEPMLTGREEFRDREAYNFFNLLSNGIINEKEFAEQFPCVRQLVC